MLQLRPDTAKIRGGGGVEKRFLGTLFISLYNYMETYHDLKTKSLDTNKITI